MAVNADGVGYVGILNVDVDRPWNEEEDLILGQTYIDIHDSKDHHSPIFWHEFVAAFNGVVSTDKKRRYPDVHARFYDMKTKVETFNSIYTKMEEQRPNDSEEAIMEEAKAKFHVRFNMSFLYENVWNIWKYACFW